MSLPSSGQQLSTELEHGDGGSTNSKTPTGPGQHGTGLNGTSYGNTTLQPAASNRLVYAAGQAFTVSFTNQGDNDEFNIKVTLKIARTSGGSPLTLTKTVPRATKGEKVTVTLPLNRQPPLDTPLNISVTVAAVPGEQKTDNNKSSYPSLFDSGLASGPCRSSVMRPPSSRSPRRERRCWHSSGCSS